MNLTADLVDQFVDATKDEEKKSSDGIVYGTVVKNDNATYVQLDGSSTATPVSTTMNVKHGDRVTVLIKNHTATITGNYSYPADSTTSTMTSINSFNMAVGNKVTVETLTANEAFVKFLLSDKITAETIIAAEAEINKLDVDELTVENLKTVYGEFEELDAYFADLGVVAIDKATIQDLNAVSGQFRELNVDFAKFEELVTTKATVGDLFAKNVEAEIINSTALNTKFANIDFANIKEAAIEKIYSSIGVIQGFTAKDATVTDKLTAVEIDGDVITANTLKADRLILKDSTSGLYYQLNVNALGETVVEELTEDERKELQNGLHGSVIIAKSVTADKISVSDLTAFKALIAGFTLKDNEYVLDENGEYVLEEGGTPKLLKVGAIHSGVKSSVDNTTRGIYLDNNGQVNFGDINNFLKFYQAVNGKYKLAIKASEIILESGKNIETEIGDAIANQVIEYAVSTSKDTPPSGNGGGNCDVEVILNEDGTQTLSIVSADIARKHSATLAENGDGTYILVIADSELDDGESHGTSLVQNSDGTYKLAITTDNNAASHSIEILRNVDGTNILSVARVSETGRYHVAVTENDDGTLTVSIDDAITWSEVPPEWSPGMYLWTRKKIVYSNPERIVYTEPVCDISWGAVNGLGDDVHESIANATSATESKLNETAGSIITSLEDLIDDVDVKVTYLGSKVDLVEENLRQIVTGKNGATMMEQTESGWSLNFFSAVEEAVKSVESMKTALELQGKVLFKQDENGNPNLILQSSEKSQIKLKLDNDSIGFLGTSGEEIGRIEADTEGRLGIAVDNETVTGELRQSNQNKDHGEFVWQVRSNGNYGLSWKRSD